MGGAHGRHHPNQHQQLVPAREVARSVHGTAAAPGLVWSVLHVRLAGGDLHK